MNNIMTFNHSLFGAIRTLTAEDGEIWFVAKDVTDSLGFATAKDGIRGLDEDERGRQNVPTPSGTQSMSVINESGLYSCILKSRKPEAVKFKKWVTSEVLPSIRKTGSYGIASIDLSDPVQVTALLTQSLGYLKKQQLTIEQQSLKIEIDKPKVVFAENVKVSDNCVGINEAAKRMEVGPNKLRDWMKKHKILRLDNLPYQRYIDIGRFEVDTRTREDKWGKKITYSVSVLTPNGFIWLEKIVREHFHEDAA